MTKSTQSSPRLLIVIGGLILSTPALPKSDNQGWIDGYVIGERVWLHEQDALAYRVEDSCRFNMCIYPVGTISACYEFGLFFGDIDQLFPNVEIERILYNVHTKKIKQLGDR